MSNQVYDDDEWSPAREVKKERIQKIHFLCIIIELKL